MATYYVWSGAGGANNGSSWTDAYTSFASAITAASTNGDIVLVHKSHTENLGADATYTVSAKIFILCVDKDASNALAVMGASAWIGSNSAARNITMNGSYYMYGITFRTSTGLFRSIIFSGAGSQATHEKCYYWRDDDSAHLRFGNIDVNSHFTLIDSTFRVLNNYSNVLHVSGSLSLRGAVVTINDTGSYTNFFEEITSPDSTGIMLDCEGVDFAATGVTSIIASITKTPTRAVLKNCKLGSGQALMASQANPNRSSVEVTAYNCAVGDVHYNFWHQNALGETIVSTVVYADDGAEWNTAGDKFSWKITTTSDCHPAVPYVSPWIHLYHEGTSAITPTLECLRDNSSGAVYQDDEVRGEFLYQGTSGSTSSTQVHDGVIYPASPDDQDSSSIAWTGATGTPGKFKLNPASAITPAEIGNLSARVWVGEPSITVYVDPQIRT